MFRSPLILALFFLPICCVVAAEPVGIVKEKPASGWFVETPRGFMVPYTTTIPGTDVRFEMVPIPGGVFKLGSPDNEPGRNVNEGPQIEVEVEPYWMGKYEVTWSEYDEFVKTYNLFKQFEAAGVRPVTRDNEADAVTSPTLLYDWERVAPAGKEPRYPATSIKQFAAKQYTKWLGKLTGDFYRLSTEAEWEYACRAGSTTAYSFGDDRRQLTDYGWFDGNSEDEETGQSRYHEVGKKKPNPWGLYDMHGNAGEWVLDELREGWLKPFAGRRVKAMEIVCWPIVMESRVIRGGSFWEEPRECRSASRKGSRDRDWVLADAEFPKSPWWLSQSGGFAEPHSVGFRIVRPLHEPEEKEKPRYWDADHDETRNAVRNRMERGKGVRGIVDMDLPEAAEKLKEATK